MLFRVKNRLNYSYFKFRTRGVYCTPPTPCDSSAPCDVHTMLGRRDFALYLVAIKSLLRFYPSVAVTVHSDGTLDSASREVLQRHVPGCRFIAADEARARAARALGRSSFLYGCRDFDVNYRRLIDTELWSTSAKRIIIDSDILVLRSPAEVVDWIENGKGAFLIGQAPPSAPAADDRSPLPAGAHVQTVFKRNLGPLSEALGFAKKFQDGTTAGFYGCESELRLNKIEQVVRKCLDLGIPVEHWGSDQCVVIYLLSLADACTLSPERYFNFWPDEVGRIPCAHVVHFLGTNRFYKNVYTRLASKVVRELSAARSCS